MWRKDDLYIITMRCWLDLHVKYIKSMCFVLFFFLCFAGWDWIHIPYNCTFSTILKYDTSHSCIMQHCYNFRPFFFPFSFTGYVSISSCTLEIHYDDLLTSILSFWFISLFSISASKFVFPHTVLCTFYLNKTTFFT